MPPKLSKIDVVNKFLSIHSTTFDYSYVEYNGMHTKVDIGCKIHGVFQQTHTTILIEYDGEQHFRPTRFKKAIQSVEEFLLIKEKDKIKSDYAVDNGYTLLRIPFWEQKNINVILEGAVK
jgi:hypothetical protein